MFVTNVYLSWPVVIVYDNWWGLGINGQQWLSLPIVIINVSHLLFFGFDSRCWWPITVRVMELPIVDGRRMQYYDLLFHNMKQYKTYLWRISNMILITQCTFYINIVFNNTKRQFSTKRALSSFACSTCWHYERSKKVE